MRRSPLLASVPLLALFVGAAAFAGSTSGPAAGAAPGFRLERLAHVDPPGSTADVYGFGTYAYLSSYRSPDCPAAGVRVYSLKNPRKPRLVSTFAHGAADRSLTGSDTQKTIVKPIKTPRFKGVIAVTGFQRCVTGGFQGFGVYDVTNPARPKKLAVVSTEPRGAHELWVQTKGNRVYVYLAVSNSELMSSPDYDAQKRTATIPGDPDFRIYDVTNPRRPVRVGDWGAWKTLGIHPTNGRGSYKANFVHSVYTNQAATRAFLSYWDLGTVILDISRPAQPQYLGRTPVETNQPEGDAHSVALGRNGTLLIETHEAPRAAFPTLYDISDPRAPRKLSDFMLPTAGPPPDASFLNGVHDPKILGNRAYFSWYRQGVVVADISNPSDPRLLAQFVPPGSASVWGVFATSKYVLASDMDSGLWVLSLRPTSG
ncbi:MAG: hypothetical protein H0U03_13370 [Actinobacteria bacterium]|nr:hypothetical protein [Actinomycetota bacterium]